MVSDTSGGPAGVSSDRYPTDAADIPRCTNRRYWRHMARSARMVNPDVMEVTSYHDKRLRMLMAAFLLMMIGIPFVSAAMSDEPLSTPIYGLVDSTLYVFSPEHSPRLKGSYDFYKDYKPGGGSYESYEEFARDHAASLNFWDRFRRAGFIGVIVYWFGILALLGTVLFSARRSPVWFDRKRREIWTWRKNKLYVENLDQYVAASVSSAPGHPVFRKSTVFGPLLIWMHDPDNPEDVRGFKIGTYPPTNFDQNIDLLNLIRAFESIPVATPMAQGPQREEAWLDRLIRRGTLPVDILRRLAGFSLGPNWARAAGSDRPTQSGDGSTEQDRPYPLPPP